MTKTWNTTAGRGASAALLMASLTLVACSTPDAPKEQMAVSRAAVERANGSAADAAVELAAGRDKLARAEVAMANRDYALARQLAEQAEADAALADARARSMRSQRALAELRDSIRALRQEIGQR